LTRILAGFAGAMAGSVAYRFWARIYVFPSDPVTTEDKRRMVELDRAFAEGLVRYCSARLEGVSGKGDLPLLCSSLTYFVMGLMTFAEFMDEKKVREELERGWLSI
jgi:hypothetical protein